MNLPIPAAILFVISQGLDALSSWISLHRGSVEFNPMVASHEERIWPIKILGTIAALIVMYLLWRRPKARRFFVPAVCILAGLTTLAAAWNLFQ